MDKYHYDEQGYLIKKSKEGTSWDDCVEEYAYNENDRILSIEVTEKTSPTKQTYTLVYHYEDLYFYNPEK